jgi:hypothetical protein
MRESAKTDILEQLQLAAIASIQRSGILGADRILSRVS